MKERSLKKGLIMVFAANLINLLINLIRGFIVPRYLSVDTYAMIKNYQLYISYIGVLHLGYLDGIYLKYGGKDITLINRDEICFSHSNILALQLFMILIWLPIGLLTKNFVLAVFALSLLPANLIEYFKNIFQATGEFELYSRVIYILSIFTFAGTLLLLFVFRYIDYKGYVFIYLMAYLFIWVYLEYISRRKFNIIFKFNLNLRSMVIDCRNGFSLMLGNFSSILLTSMDRWFVKFLLPTADFAYYSFAVSIENLVTVFISPVVTTFYNYLCIEKNSAKIIRIKKICMISGSYMIALAFPVKFILQTYLVKYIESVTVLFVLFSTQALYLVIKGVYVNIYKARGMQKIYLKQLISVIIIGFILNVLFYLVYPGKESIAIATLISVFIWWIICSKTFEELRTGIIETGIYFISIIFYLFCGNVIDNSIMGFVLYIVIISVVFTIFFRDIMRDMLKAIKNIYKEKRIIN